MAKAKQIEYLIQNLPTPEPEEVQVRARGRATVTVSPSLPPTFGLASVID